MEWYFSNKIKWHHFRITTLHKYSISVFSFYFSYVCYVEVVFTFVAKVPSRSQSCSFLVLICSYSWSSFFWRWQVLLMYYIHAYTLKWATEILKITNNEKCGFVITLIKWILIRSELTLRRLSLFFKILSHLQHWCLCCIYFGHHSLSLLQTWLLFRHGILLLPTCLSGLESPQALRRINSNAVVSLFWLQLGQTNQPRCMLASATPMISSSTAREISQLLTRLRGPGRWTPQLRGWQEGTAPFETPNKNNKSNSRYL